jgi:nicotinamide-nucleotide amidase
VHLERRIVRTIGLPESVLAERLAGFGVEEPDVRLAYLPQASGVALCLTASSPDATWLGALLDRCEARLRERAGAHAYGGEPDTLSSVVGRLLAERRLTLATAESLSGGSVGAAITSTPGSSAYYLGGIVAYANAAKESLLGVGAETLRLHGAVSAEAAEAMASGARSRFGADLAVSTTGVAGPEGGSAERPVGLAYVGIATQTAARSERFQFTGTREEVIARTTSHALDLVRRHLVADPAWSGHSSRS